MDLDISEFISENRVCSVCFINEQKEPHCISCFYVFDIENKNLILKSTKGTEHTALTGIKSIVSGTIIPENFDPLKIKGIQFTGEVIETAKLNAFDLSKHYYLKYPFAMVMPGYLWAIELRSVKFTDNTKGFGNKTSWKR